MSSQDLDDFNVAPDRPPSLDEKGFRLFIIPANVKGYFRTRRNIVYLILILIFLVIPWTKINGEQSIFLDLSERKFHLFGYTFFSHDGPYLFFVLILSAFSLVLVTAVYGRLWCGWACPQTVFIDFIYRRIEEWTEGNHLKRRKLGKAPWTKEKILRKTAKWVLYFIVSSHIAHSFTAYFVGANNLVWITLGSPFENWSLFLFVQIFTLITLVNFGWFREQFCLIACPYGRFQSALLDDNSRTILYDAKRGEPRKAKGLSDFGDCISCNRCVNVCPTGIDIRDGLQMECIACTACADACDEVMEKIGKPKGLIRYSSLNELKGQTRKLLSPRVIAYSFIISIIMSGFAYTLNARTDLEVKVIRAVETPYKDAGAKENNAILNHFRFHITNQNSTPVKLKEIVLDQKAVELISPQFSRVLQPGEDAWIHVFAKFPKSLSTSGKTVAFWTIAYESSDLKQKKGKMILISPFH